MYNEITKINNNTCIDVCANDIKTMNKKQDTNINEYELTMKIDIYKIDITYCIINKHFNEKDLIDVMKSKYNFEHNLEL